MRCPECKSTNVERYTNNGIDCLDCGYAGRESLDYNRLTLLRAQGYRDRLAHRRDVPEFQYQSERNAYETGVREAERSMGFVPATRNVSKDPRMPVYRDTVSDDFLRGIRSEKPK